MRKKCVRVCVQMPTLYKRRRDKKRASKIRSESGEGSASMLRHRSENSMRTTGPILKPKQKPKVKNSQSSDRRTREPNLIYRLLCNLAKGGRTDNGQFLTTFLTTFFDRKSECGFCVHRKNQSLIYTEYNPIFE